MIAAWATGPGLRARVEQLLTAWQATDIPASELAGMLIGASAAHAKAREEEQVELVWTGPSSQIVATRKTEPVLLQVIAGATKRLFVTSFVAYQVQSIVAALAAAIQRNVAVSMLLEASEQDGGTVSIDALAAMRAALPSATLYSWREKSDAFAGGKVHAKCAVADEAICFISSANLTGYAMERNIEAGVLITGGRTPRILHQHLEALALTGRITKI
jgi:phosphatidylserine/phosphatidylglycerophosphate/cardiolipin synthase-like enzyme